MTGSIKSKLSFNDYKPSLPNDIKTERHNAVIESFSVDEGMTSKHNDVKTESNNDINTECRKYVKKVKRTFYILESIADQLDVLYAKKITEKKKIDKLDIVTQALINLFGNSEGFNERSFKKRIAYSYPLSSFQNKNRNHGSECKRCWD